jgi:uncharacterized protein
MSVLPLPKASACQTQMEIAFAGEALVLDACGALYVPERDLLAVADLHLEKGSFFAARGNPVPCYDTRDTLMRLAEAIRCYRPRTLVALGDSFHDGRAGERMRPDDARLLRTLVSSVAEWVWLTGNHDRGAPEQFPGGIAAHFNAGALTLCHRPEDGAAPLIAGHYHPKHVLRLSGRHIAARCFVLGPELMLMPAFGAYAGGLATRHEAIGALFAAQPRRHILIYGEKLWAVD